MQLAGNQPSARVRGGGSPETGDQPSLRARRRRRRSCRRRRGGPLRHEEREREREREREKESVDEERAHASHPPNRIVGGGMLWCALALLFSQPPRPASLAPESDALFASTPTQPP